MTDECPHCGSVLELIEEVERDVNSDGSPDSASWHYLWCPTCSVRVFPSLSARAEDLNSPLTEKSDTGG